MTTQYHVHLSLAVPEWAFAPSRAIQHQLSGDGELQTALALGSPVTSMPRHGELASDDRAAEPQVTPQPVAMDATKPHASAVPAVRALKEPEPTVATLDNPQPSSAVAVQEAEEPKILFAGDSMMQGVAPLVISQLKKQYPKALLLDLSKQSTGLTVRRYFDWPTKIREETAKRGIREVVIFLGPNDPWDITENKQRFVFPSQEWENKYRERVVEVMQYAKDRQMRIVWIGLPGMRNERVRKGAAIQNRIFREECSRFGFQYLNTEDLFGAVDAPFTKYISDERNRQVLVRADDGTHFTRTGLRLLADRLLPLLQGSAEG